MTVIWLWPTLGVAILSCASIYFQEQLYFYIWVLGVSEVPAYVAPSFTWKENASPFPCAQIYSPPNQSVDSLRLLRLLPGSKGLSCRTETTTFHEKPRYRALSYEWGSSHRTMPIVINNVETRIGQNLWVALYHLRDSRNEQVLWADAICINQHDLAEKARLVPQMSLIYRRASEVIVWLGPHQAPGMVNLKQLAKWSSASPQITRTYHESWWQEAVPWLFDLIHNNYWKRTWIIQEIGEAVALSVHFGRQSLPWQAFNSAVTTYRNCFPKDLFTDRISAFEALRSSKREGEIYALTDLISSFSDTFCAVPHDKIYAFLGMADDDSLNFIPAAYNTSLAGVYTDVMLFLSNSAIDLAVKEVELVFMSALVRRLLTREARIVVDRVDKPRSVLKNAEPYTYYETVKDDDGKSNLVARTAYAKVWHEWHYSRHEQKTTRWLPTGPERLGLWTAPDQTIYRPAALKAKGVLVGKIESVGPTVEMFLASIRVSRAWKTMIIENFREKSYQKRMIALYERLHDIIGQESAVRSIDSTTAFSLNSEFTITRPTDSARVFIGSNGFLGIASPGARIGDQIVQFWMSSTSAIVRNEADDAAHSEYKIIGRCSIVKEGYSHDWDIPKDKLRFLSDHESMVYLRTDVLTLTLLTLNALDLKD